MTISSYSTEYGFPTVYGLNDSLYVILVRGRKFSSIISCISIYAFMSLTKCFQLFAVFLNTIDSRYIAVIYNTIVRTPQQLQ